MRECKDCYYYGSCNADCVCWCYFPVTEMSEEEYLKYMVECSRKDFQNVWEEYLSEEDF